MVLRSTVRMFKESLCLESLSEPLDGTGLTEGSGADGNVRIHYSIMFLLCIKVV